MPGLTLHKAHPPSPFYLGFPVSQEERRTALILDTKKGTFAEMITQGHKAFLN